MFPPSNRLKLTATLSNSGSKSSTQKSDTEVVLLTSEPKGHPQTSKLSPFKDLLATLTKAELFTGKTGNMQFLRFQGKDAEQNVLFLGLGAANSERLEDHARSAGGLLALKFKAEKLKSASIDASALGSLKSETLQSVLVAVAEGFALASYDWKSKEAFEAHLDFKTDSRSLKSELEDEFNCVTLLSESVDLTRNWSNLPSNLGTPSFYAAEAVKEAKKYGVKARVMGEAECKREKMGLFLGVGQGSVQENKMVVLEYTPKTKSKGQKTLAFVGKGVTFDSGGISIKPSMRMEDMKHDMTGAATVMGAVLLAARLKAPNRIIGILAFAENMPSGNAIQPGNVLTSRSGKTVEIINTDAEGRLVLADALDYVQDFKPDAIINAATLTGAVSVALGKICAGLMGNNETLIEQVQKAGSLCGERLWNFPMFDEYFEDIKSDSADMKNSANDGYAGTIRGGMFLKQFIKKNTPWAHLDIAGTAYNVPSPSYFPRKGASGAYVRTLARLALDY